MNAAEHRFISALALASAAASSAPSPEERLPQVVVGGIGGFCFGTLPDIAEPATTPHHRQFFHSLLFAGLVGYGVYKLYQWQTETPGEQLFRTLGLVAGGAYLVHLMLDATTKLSLPLVGRIG